MMDEIMGDPPDLDQSTQGVLDLYWLLRRGRSSEVGLTFSLQDLLACDPILLERLLWADEEYIRITSEERSRKLKEIGGGTGGKKTVHGRT
jgi:hypothetical protein